MIMRLWWLREVLLLLPCSRVGLATNGKVLLRAVSSLINRPFLVCCSYEQFFIFQHIVISSPFFSSPFNWS